MPPMQSASRPPPIEYMHIGGSSSASQAPPIRCMHVDGFGLNFAATSTHESTGLSIHHAALQDRLKPCNSPRSIQVFTYRQLSNVTASWGVCWVRATIYFLVHRACNLAIIYERCALQDLHAWVDRGDRNIGSRGGHGR